MEKLKVLMVDDKEENLVALEALLIRPDIEIIKTTSPNHALKLAWEQDIALALIDVQMPEMDGFELVDLLKSNPKTNEILVLFVTAISKESKYAIKGFQSGAIDYLYKPLDPYVTAAKVDSFIKLARAQRDIISKNKELLQYSIIVNNSADVIIRVNAKDFRILHVNPAIERVLGFRPSDITQHSFLSLMKDREFAIAQLDRLIREDRAYISFETEIENFRKEVRWFECRITLQENTFFVNMNDVTLKRSINDELVRTKELAEQARAFKEEFLANMSHEIRTPINGVISLTEILSQSDLSKDQREILNLISTSSQSLLGVVNDILDISKIEAGKFKIVRNETNVRALVRAACNLLKYKAQEKGISLKYHIDDAVPALIMADSLRLNQILLNLLGNAMKFTDRGSVNVEVKADAPKGNKIVLRFMVEDTGIGIPQDKLEVIFENFTQATDATSQRYGGTGLGLTIVKRLAELKGGTLHVQSRLGKGSIFTFQNSFEIAEIKQETEPAEIEIIPFVKRLQVLLAEDNYVNQFAATHILNRWNIDVDVAETGTQVLEKLRANDYDLILMDTYMPEMNGYQAARKIREEFSGQKAAIPIISLSAAVMDSERQEAINSGMNEIVNKPFNPEELYLKIKSLI
jgi:PAS domain S-box-containing protein